MAYIEGNDWTSGSIWKYATDALEKVRNQIALSNSTAGKCTSMQVIKQPENGRISTIKEQKWSYFQTNYDL